MIAKCQCQWCEGNIEFDPAKFQESGRGVNWIFGQTVPCPHCGKETMLCLDIEEAPNIAPEAASTIQHPKVTPKAPSAGLTLGRLAKCPDCWNPVSPRAYFCPHCGAPLPPKPGILDIVFKVVLSAIVVCIVLAVLAFFCSAILAGFFAGISGHNP